MPRYARKLTKQELINGGIFITPENRIFKNGVDITDNMSLNPSGYKIFQIYDRDENGQCIKKYYTNKHGQYTYTYKQRTITLNRALLAWYQGEVQNGYVSDHIDNIRDNYDPDNLQPLTPGENVNKEKNWHTTELKCNMHKPREFYEKKLEQYMAEYDKAKYEHNAENAHYLRVNISQTRARLRYWESHKEEYEAYIREKEIADTNKEIWRQNVKDRKILNQYKQMLKEAGNKTMWHQLCKVYATWDRLDSIQKEHVFDVLHKFFSKYNVSENFLIANNIMEDENV